MHVLESQNFTMPMESPDTIVPSLETYGCEQSSSAVTPTVIAYPSTPTAQTKVRSPRILSAPIRSSARPDEKSHFRKLLSEHPVTSQESDQFSSESSDSESAFAVEACVCRGTGGPQAILRMRLLTLSRRRR